MLTLNSARGPGREAAGPLAVIQATNSARSRINWSVTRVSRRVGASRSDTRAPKAAAGPLTVRGASPLCKESFTYQNTTNCLSKDAGAMHHFDSSEALLLRPLAHITRHAFTEAVSALLFLM